MSEDVMIESAFVAMSATVISQFDRVEIVGHNIEFDLQFLKKRMIIHGIHIPHWWPKSNKPWENNVRDTMKIWDSRYGEMTGQDELCRILGIEGKGDFNGSMVAEAWAKGEYERVAEYCRDDVRKVRMIDERFRKVGL